MCYFYFYRKKRETADKLIKEHGGITSTLENGKIFMKILHGLPETPKDGFTFDDFSKALDKVITDAFSIKFSGLHIFPFDDGFPIFFSVYQEI